MGKDGVEAAFESHLKGHRRHQVVSLNEDGKITGEYYSKEPVPGNTVELTIDLDLQQAAEDALAATITRMTGEDGDETRAAPWRWYRWARGKFWPWPLIPPMISPHSDRAASTRLSTMTCPPLHKPRHQRDVRPRLHHQAPDGRGRAGEGIITPTQEIYSPSRWVYPNDPTHSGANCAGGNSTVSSM